MNATVRTLLVVMGSAYLFSLVLGLGILVAQSLLGGKDFDGDGFDQDFEFDGDVEADVDGFAGGADADLDADADADADVDADAGGVVHADGSHAGGSHAGGVGGVVALFLSVRFWVFACLGFGLPGTMLTFFSSVAWLAVLLTSLGLGLTSGLMASLAFRALKRSSGVQTENTNSAVGRLGRVLVPMDLEHEGQIRIQLGGHTVDLIAKTESGPIPRGVRVVIEEVEGDIALVSKAPKELQ